MFLSENEEMKIGILGTGMVGTTIGTKLVQLGHHVMVGARETGNPKALTWLLSAGKTASQGSFAHAASFGEILFNCTAGSISLDALKMAGADNLGDKILIDVANPLDMSKGMPPTLTISNTDSLGERIQAAFPRVQVVKALNTINCNIMVNPGLIKGEHDLFICGNDASAKTRVAGSLAEWFGWRRENIIDVGDITAARGTEMYIALWVRVMLTLHTAQFNVHVVK
jgi:predicted dinucleotide-binding enzyme